jgi:putative flavoprotein involved in K+ transport
MERLLDTFDDWAGTGDAAPERLPPTELPQSTRLELDFHSGEIRSVLWATGYRPDYRWLDVPVLDTKSHLRHDGGVVVDSPGLYALGLPVLRRRKSTFICGVEDDARDVIDDLSTYLAGESRAHDYALARD